MSRFSPTYEIVAEYAEIGIDALLDNEVLKGIPVVSTISSICRELYQVDRLISLGLLQNQNRLGGNVWLDFVDDPEKQNDIIVTSFGKTFYHNSPAALKRN